MNCTHGKQAVDSAVICIACEAERDAQAARVPELERQLGLARSNASVANQMFERIANENVELKRRLAEAETRMAALALAAATSAPQKN